MSLSQHQLVLSLGSNQGNSFEHLQEAVQQLFEQVGAIQKISSVYKSKALGFEGADFLNCVVLMQTNCTAKQALHWCLKIEQDMGRIRSEDSVEGYQDRIIDLDVLFYDELLLDEEDLQLPHPRMQQRRFVLQPLCDIAPDLQHPGLQRKVSQLLDHCEDDSVLEKQPKWLRNPKDDLPLSQYNYIAIEGNIGAGKTSLAELIASEFNAKLILERFKDNPFLPKFYKKPQRYAFPLEMSFLADRYQQLLDDIGQYDLFSDFMVADYDRYKSLVFAQVTLQEEEFVLYKRLHGMMYKDMPAPDCYVYLFQNTERLLENIKKRGRSYEQEISADYLSKINQGYLDFIRAQHQLNVKMVDISELDFVHNRADYLQVIRALLPA
ncbi:2-amino-4-hydroxy-6-hydroxymethyldihydropteridine diphosphokinase [Croceiramulus getboli]|nr:2-amino-4-hydroxy-6-hydroxymethyldihydropteridine diphosphokinase [Flavobacteriaceae bacterium YJPT1-3]